MSGMHESRTMSATQYMMGTYPNDPNRQNSIHQLPNGVYNMGGPTQTPQQMNLAQQQQQQQQQQLNMGMRMNTGRPSVPSFAPQLTDPVWNPDASFGTLPTVPDTLLQSSATNAAMAPMLPLDTPDFMTQNSTANMAMPGAQAFATSNIDYQSGSSNHYQTSSTLPYHPSRPLDFQQIPATSTYQPALDFQTATTAAPTASFQTQQLLSFDPSPTFPPTNDLLNPFNAPVDTNDSFASIDATASFATAAPAQSFSNSLPTPQQQSFSVPDGSTLGSVLPPPPNAVVPISAPDTQSTFARMAMTQTQTLTENVPRMSWSNGAVLPTQSHTVPVWVSVQTTDNNFGRISEVLDEEGSPVQVAAGLAHSPLSMAPASINNSPGQYRPMSGNFATHSSPMWHNQQRLPSVSESAYSGAALSPLGLSDKPISQSIEDRPSSGGSSRHEQTPPAAGSGAKPWATPADWVYYRETITALYIEEDKPLKEVMELMANQHSFHATEKMYKIKIKKWNLKKNLRETEVQAIMQAVGQRELEGKNSEVEIHGKKFELTQILRHAKKKGILRSQRRTKKKRPQEPVTKQEVPHYVRIYTPPPELEVPQYVLRAPDSLHIPEQVLRNINLWMHGKMQSGAWTGWFAHTMHEPTTETEGDPSGASITLISDFYNHFLQGLQTLRTTQNQPAAQQSFNVAFATLKPIMMQDDPRVMAMLLLVGLRTEKEGHGRSLGDMLWRYVSELSPACVGVHSPLNRVWGTIATAFIYNDVGQSMVLMRFLCDQIKQWTDNVGVMYMDFYMFQSEIERLCFGSSPSTRSTLQGILDEARMVPNPDYDNIILQKNCCHHLARSFIKDNYPEEARNILLQTPSAPLNNSRSARVAYLDLLGNIELQCGMPEQAAEWMEKAVQLSTMEWGELSSGTMYMTDSLIKIYRQMGQLNRAEFLQIEHDRREKVLEKYHGTATGLPEHIPPVQIGC